MRPIPVITSLTACCEETPRTGCEVSQRHSLSAVVQTLDSRLSSRITVAGETPLARRRSRQAAKCSGPILANVTSVIGSGSPSPLSPSSDAILTRSNRPPSRRGICSSRQRRSRSPNVAPGGVWPFCPAMISASRRTAHAGAGWCAGAVPPQICSDRCPRCRDQRTAPRGGSAP